MSGIVGSFLNHRGSGIVAKLGTDAYQLTSAGAGKKAAIEQTATAGIADDAITLAKMASGTDGNIISYDASGNPVAIATGSDGQILTSTGAGSPPAFEAAAGGGGLVLQVTNRQTQTATTHTSTTASATDIYGTITPSSTDSKVLVCMNMRVHGIEGSGTGISAKMSIYKDVGGGGYSEIWSVPGGSSWGFAEIGVNNERSWVYRTTWTFLDAPSSTSALTYKVYLGRMLDGGSGDSFYTLGSNVDADITLMEIDGS